MSGSSDIRLEAQRRRLMIMIGIDVVAVIAAIALMIAYQRTGDARMLYGFIAALVAGFAAQFWMVLGWVRENRSQKP